MSEQFHVLAAHKVAFLTACSNENQVERPRSWTPEYCRSKCFLGEEEPLQQDCILRQAKALDAITGPGLVPKHHLHLSITEPVLEFWQTRSSIFTSKAANNGKTTSPPGRCIQLFLPFARHTSRAYVPSLNGLSQLRFMPLPAWKCKGKGWTYVCIIQGRSWWQEGNCDLIPEKKWGLGFDANYILPFVFKGVLIFEDWDFKSLDHNFRAILHTRTCYSRCYPSAANMKLGTTMHILTWE